MKSEIQESATKRILYLPHAVKQMSRPDRMITPADVESCVHSGDVIEEYPNDPRGKSALMMIEKDARCVHVVCAPKSDYLAIITAYIPDPIQWESDNRTRKA